MNDAEVLDAVESTFVIVFLILSILSVKKFIKSLLLNCEGIFRSGDICLFVNLATVLIKNKTDVKFLMADPSSVKHEFLLTIVMSAECGKG